MIQHRQNNNNNNNNNNYNYNYNNNNITEKPACFDDEKLFFCWSLEK